MTSDVLLQPAIAIDDEINETTVSWAAQFSKVWFRYQLRGLERLPPAPCLLVGNHSGIGFADVLCLGGAWQKALGQKRKGYGLTSDLIYKSPVVGPIARQLGALRASPETARRVLSAGHDLLVFPGGEIDSFRPFYQPREVHFGKRRGYARIALEMGVPIVPVATIGSHWTYLMAPGGQELAERLRLKRWLRIDAVPLPVGLCASLALLAGGLPLYGLAGALAAVSLIPSPVRITSEVMAPIDPKQIGTELTGEDRVEAVHQRVLRDLRLAVGSLRHDHCRSR